MKPKLLICSDSPFIDTGFGRVAREIGVGLQERGLYEVAYHAWYHEYTDKVVPCRIYTTDRTNYQLLEADKYGKYSYDKVVDDFKPDVVLTIGDTWMIDHIVPRPRNYKLLCYVPIDSVPIRTDWLTLFAKADRLVTYGYFGAQAFRFYAPDYPLSSVPHGVDINVFKPLENTDRSCLQATGKFVVGCVARNSTRKNLPRLLKAFKKFVTASSSCERCGHVMFVPPPGDKCMQCGHDVLTKHAPKTDAFLYMHTVPTDPHGFDLIDLIKRFELNGKVGFPHGLTISRGAPDKRLNYLYNCMDVFTLPTTGEGWGLPIIEAMAAGLPVLVTDYSAHLEFVNGAGETINVSEFETTHPANGERAIVDLNDYVMKLDRFYYSNKAFVAKWGRLLQVQGGMSPEDLAKLECGLGFRVGMGKVARQRALQYNWSAVVDKWTELLAEVAGPGLTACVDEHESSFALELA